MDIIMYCLVHFKATLSTCSYKKDVVLIDRFGGEEQHEENRVHLGNAIMSFYSALIDLLGRCAPEMHVSRTALTPLISLKPHSTLAQYVVEKKRLVSYRISYMFISTADPSWQG